MGHGSGVRSLQGALLRASGGKVMSHLLARRIFSEVKSRAMMIHASTTMEQGVINPECDENGS
jgi:hypothetical protein